CAGRQGAGRLRNRPAAHGEERSNPATPSNANQPDPFPRISLSFHRGACRPGTMERTMKKMQSALVAAALAIGMAPPALAGVDDPEVIIYRFPGVFDDGGGVFAGTATAFACTNFSGVTENIRFVTREWDTTLKSNAVLSIPHLGT